MNLLAAIIGKSNGNNISRIENTWRDLGFTGAWKMDVASSGYQPQVIGEAGIEVYNLSEYQLPLTDAPFVGIRSVGRGFVGDNRDFIGVTGNWVYSAVIETGASLSGLQFLIRSKRSTYYYMDIFFDEGTLGMRSTGHSTNNLWETNITVQPSTKYKVCIISDASTGRVTARLNEVVEVSDPFTFLIGATPNTPALNASSTAGSNDFQGITSLIGVKIDGIISSEDVDTLFDAYDIADGAMPTLSARYWRVYITANNGHAADSSISEIFALDEYGVPLQMSGDAGAGVITTDQSGGSSPNDANNGDERDRWIGRTGLPVWWSIDFKQALAVSEWGIMSNLDTGADTARAVKDFVIEYSDDNTNWNTFATATNETDWDALNMRYFGWENV